MSLLQQVQRGKAHLPPRILVYGTEGVGKSSLAATRQHRRNANASLGEESGDDEVYPV